jgi:hypothetical protein
VQQERVKILDYTFKKSTCERYDIRFGSWGWAIITIDENGGLFNCHSDYGDYNYSWPNHGRKSFKHFILELARDYHYLLGKVSKEDYFDYVKSRKSWQKAIIKARKDGDCTKEEARNAWEFIDGLDEYSNSPHIIQKELYESDAIEAIAGSEPWYMFDTEMEYSPQAMAFATEIMPIFADIIRTEIEQSKKVG